MSADRRSTFYQGDVTRAVKGAIQAGREPVTVKIGPDGAIELRFKAETGIPVSGDNPWDAVLE